jgi:hypothetical protein
MWLTALSRSGFRGDCRQESGELAKTVPDDIPSIPETFFFYLGG